MPTLNNHILRTDRNGVAKLIFNRPDKFNALNSLMYANLIENLDEIASNPEIHVDCLKIKASIKSRATFFWVNYKKQKNANRRYVDVLIDFPKILVAIVNGPAIGITVTTLALFDLVYATDTATFQTPFSKIGLCAEGCSSVTFPTIFGRSKSTELLSFNYKMTAKEALTYGFVVRIIRPDQIDTIQAELEHACAHNSNKSLKVNKRLVNDSFLRTRMHEANARETEALKQCYRSGDFVDIVMRMFTNKM